MLLVVILVLGLVAPTRARSASEPGTPDLPYPRSPSPTSRVYAISEEGRSQAELLALDVLAGVIARKQSPSLYRVANASWDTAMSTDSYSRWLVEMRRGGVAVNVSLIRAPLANIVMTMSEALHLADVESFVRCNASDKSAASEKARSPS